MTDVILDVSHIAKTFGHVQALKDITLSLRKGRVHTLLGENGAGKSTLMKILAGVYPPTQGTITLRGETITINNPQHSRQLGIAGNDSNLLIVFYVQIMPDDLVMQLHRF